MKAVRLRTEHLTDPVGVDFKAPRFFWNCEGGERQTAYRVTARDDKDTLLMDTGKVEGSFMCCAWKGAEVPAETRVTWQVSLWDENGVEGEPEKAFFETGIGSWQAKWITGSYSVNKKKRYPVDCFKKCFEAKNGEKARLYITACGLYEAKVNGKRAGNFVLAPGITDYRKRVQYQTIDITELLQDGTNELTVSLADGWYRGSCGAWGLKNQYGTETKLLAQLVITDDEGKKETIVTDESWSWSSDGPIRFADNKDGETVDASLVPTCRGKVKVTTHPVIPSASDNVPLIEHEHLAAKKIVTPSGKTVLDFGQNIAGYVSFHLWAAAGQKIRLRFGEMLDDGGEFTQKNIRVAGENHFVIAPLPGGSFSYAKASYVSIYGKAESAWETTKEGWKYTITIPANCTAEIRLRDGSVRTVGCGTYTF